jgi:hypothetical protein
VIETRQSEPAQKQPILSRNAVLGLIAVTLAIHDTEEYFTFPMFLNSLNGKLAGWLPAPPSQQTVNNLHIALILATVLPAIFLFWAIFSPRQWLVVASLLVEVVLLVNACFHVLTAVLHGGYVPGLISAVLINLPFGMYVMRRAVGERWIGVRVALQLVAVAVLLHLVWVSTAVMARHAITQG